MFFVSNFIRIVVEKLQVPIIHIGIEERFIKNKFNKKIIIFFFNAIYMYREPRVRIVSMNRSSIQSSELRADVKRERAVRLEIRHP